MEDVLFFSPVHPDILFQVLKEVGSDRAVKQKWYQIDPYKIDPAKALFFSFKPSKTKPFEGTFSPYDPSKVIEHNVVPEATKRYFEQKVHEGERPLLFMGITHIMYKGTLDITDCPIIKG